MTKRFRLCKRNDLKSFSIRYVDIAEVLHDRLINITNSIKKPHVRCGFFIDHNLVNIIILKDLKDQQDLWDQVAVLFVLNYAYGYSQNK